MTLSIENKNKFTFQYGSTLIALVSFELPHKATFTFQYGSTLIQARIIFDEAKRNLHSNMVLL